MPWSRPPWTCSSCAASRSRFEGLLGEILVGLDRTGHLRRLVRPPAPARADADGSCRRPSGSPATRRTRPPRSPRRTTSTACWPSSAPPSPAPRAAAWSRMGDDRWWLGDRADRELAAVPLADRVEWAVYSLLSTAGVLSEAAFLDRVAGLFTGPDLPDEALVRACLESLPQPRVHPGAARHRRRPRPAQRGAQPADRGPRGPRASPRASRAGSASGSSRGGWAATRLRTTSRRASWPGRRAWAGSPRGTSRTSTSSGTSAAARRSPWEVEWTAMLSDTVLRRHARIPHDDRLVRFLVVLPERAELVRHKLERSPLLREGLEAGGWHLRQGQPRARLGRTRRGGAGGPRAAPGARPGGRAHRRPALAVRRAVPSTASDTANATAGGPVPATEPDAPGAPAAPDRRRRAPRRPARGAPRALVDGTLAPPTRPVARPPPRPDPPAPGGLPP